MLAILSEDNFQLEGPCLDYVITAVSWGVAGKVCRLLWNKTISLIQSVSAFSLT